MLFALSAIGRDRPGVVAEITGVVEAVGGGVEESHVSILCGHFALMLVMSVPDSVPRGEFRRRLSAVRTEIGLDGLTLNRLDDSLSPGDPTHIVTVYGADHRGIVPAVANAVAACGANITYMQSRLSEPTEDPTQAMVLEIAADGVADELDETLREVGEQMEAELSFRELARQVR